MTFLHISSIAETAKRQNDTGWCSLHCLQPLPAPVQTRLSFIRGA